MNKVIFFALFILVTASCNTTKDPLFGKRSAHEQYADAIKKSGLNKSALGKTWFEAAQSALSFPQVVSLPYKESGFFSADKPAAAGFVFKVVRGQNIVASLTGNPDSVLLFLELWKSPIKESSIIATMDTVTMSLSYTVTKEDSLILRIQPELLADLEYTLTLTIQPSLAFPVAESGKPHMISYWGNPRDAGARSHEGVDIGATFRTPALAAAEGIISRVNVNNLGGKVVFLRDSKTGDNLYYAHLDTQIAVQGQRVKIGDTIGLIGNTGNAKNTPPHLHFGIYTMGGAINPLPFINSNIPKPPKITASLSPVHSYLRMINKAPLYEEPETKSAHIHTVAKDEPVFILAATGNWYKVKLLNNKIGFMPGGSLTEKNVRQISLRQTQNLIFRPFTNAPVMEAVSAGEKVSVMGIYDDFYLINYQDKIGWIAKPM